MEIQKKNFILVILLLACLNTSSYTVAGHSHHYNTISNTDDVVPFRANFDFRTSPKGFKFAKGRTSIDNILSLPHVTNLLSKAVPLQKIRDIEKSKDKFTSFDRLFTSEPSIKPWVMPLNNDIPSSKSTKESEWNSWVKNMLNYNPISSKSTLINEQQTPEQSNPKSVNTSKQNIRSSKGKVTFLSRLSKDTGNIVQTLFNNATEKEPQSQQKSPIKSNTFRSNIRTTKDRSYPSSIKLRTNERNKVEPIGEKTKQTTREQTITQKNYKNNLIYRSKVENIVASARKSKFLETVHVTPLTLALYGNQLSDSEINNKQKSSDMKNREWNSWPDTWNWQSGGNGKNTLPQDTFMISPNVDIKTFTKAKFQEPKSISVEESILDKVIRKKHRNKNTLKNTRTQLSKTNKLTTKAKVSKLNTINRISNKNIKSLSKFSNSITSKSIPSNFRQNLNKNDNNFKKETKVRLNPLNLNNLNSVSELVSRQMPSNNVVPKWKHDSTQSNLNDVKRVHNNFGQEANIVSRNKPSPFSPVKNTVIPKRILPLGKRTSTGILDAKHKNSQSPKRTMTGTFVGEDGNNSNKHIKTPIKTLDDYQGGNNHGFNSDDTVGIDFTLDDVFSFSLPNGRTDISNTKNIKSSDILRRKPWNINPSNNVNQQKPILDELKLKNNLKTRGNNNLQEQITKVSGSLENNINQVRTKPTGSKIKLPYPDDKDDLQFSTQEVTPRKIPFSNQIESTVIQSSFRPRNNKKHGLSALESKVIFSVDAPYTDRSSTAISPQTVYPDVSSNDSITQSVQPNSQSEILSSNDVIADETQIGNQLSDILMSTPVNRNKNQIFPHWSSQNVKQDVWNKDNSVGTTNLNNNILHDDEHRNNIPSSDDSVDPEAINPFGITLYDEDFNVLSFEQMLQILEEEGIYI